MRGDMPAGPRIVLIAASFAAAVIAVPVVASVDGAASDRGGPAATVVTFQPIAALDTDAGRLAWMSSSSGGTPGGVVLRRLAGGPRTVLELLGYVPLDRRAERYRAHGLALAGRRVLFWTSAVGNDVERTLYRTEPGVRPIRVGRIVTDATAGGSFLVGADGDGDTLVFGWTKLANVNQQECVVEGVEPCRWQAAGGGIVRLVGRRRYRVPHVTAPALLALAGRRIAVVPSEARGPSPFPRSSANGVVEIRDVITGALRRQINAGGRVVELALSRALVAVVVARPGRAPTLDRYDTRSGRLMSRTLARGVSSLAVSGQALVYRIGRTIYAVDAAGRSARVARAAAKPIGLSVDGRRVAWAANLRGRGRIRVVTFRNVTP